jgi:hypothetical protein
MEGLWTIFPRDTIIYFRTKFDRKVFNLVENLFTKNHSQLVQVHFYNQTLVYSFYS